MTITLIAQSWEDGSMKLTTHGCNENLGKSEVVVSCKVSSCLSNSSKPPCGYALASQGGFLDKCDNDL